MNTAPKPSKGNRFLRGIGNNLRNIRSGQNLKPRTSAPTLDRQRGALFATGPRVLGGGARSVAGPGEPPENFIGGTTSRTEWFLYWALEKLLGPEGETWVYQESRLGGRHRLGGAVVDFIIYLGDIAIGVRVQTYRFHLNVSPMDQAADVAQLIALTSPSTVIVDVFEQDFINDESGQAAIRLMYEVINRQWRMSPLTNGLVVGLG